MSAGGLSAVAVSAAVVMAAAAVALVPLSVRSCGQSAALSASTLTAEAAVALREVFGTRITISSAGVVCGPKEIAELAVTEQEVVVDTRHERPWKFGWCKASLEIRGHHTAKAGIDLSRLAGRLDGPRRVLVLNVPRCKLLSLETFGADKRWQDDSFVNRCTPADFSAALAENIATARQQASRGEVTAQADAVLAARLRNALAPLAVLVARMSGRRGTTEQPFWSGGDNDAT